LDNIRGGFGIRVSGSSSDASDQWSPDGLFVIFPYDLLHILITLKRDVANQFSVKIDESLTGSCPANLNITGDWTRYTFDASLSRFWLPARLPAQRALHPGGRGFQPGGRRSDCLLRANFCAGLTIDTNIRDRSFLLRRHENGTEGTNLNAQATSNAGLPINNHGSVPLILVSGYWILDDRY
jgi:hypothetical protein